MFATVKNQESSRSHTLFQLKLVSKIPQVSTNGNILPQQVISKFSLVDLAGSERLSEGEKTLERIEEAKFINKSLSALGNVIYSLKNQQQILEKSMKKGTKVQKQALGYVPYRDSKLTHILKDSLGGNSHTHIIITLSPSVNSLQETLSSMKFAAHAKSIKQHLKENVIYFLFTMIDILERLR